jgi:hypothetical protein
MKSLRLIPTGNKRLNEVTKITEDEVQPFYFDDTRGKSLWADASRTKPDYRLNSPGDTPEASTGYQIAIDTLTYIVRTVTAQKFYEVNPSDYLPVMVGEGSFANDFLNNLTFSNAADFESGIINSASSNARLDTVETAVASITTENIYWAKALEYSINDVQRALFANNWDLIESKHKAMKKNFDLGIQKIAFLGSRTDTADIQGLLNNTKVNIVASPSYLNVPISSMTAAQFSTFVGTVIGAYVTNANATAIPDTFLIPLSDYLGLAAPVSSDFPFNSKLEYLRKAFVEITGNEKFAIKKLAYADATYNAAYGINQQVYILYRNDSDSFHMRVPQPYTVLQPGTSNNYQWQQVCTAQFTGNIILRPLEQLQFRFTL